MAYSFPQGKLFGENTISLRPQKKSHFNFLIFSFFILFFIFFFYFYSLHDTTNILPEYFIGQRAEVNTSLAGARAGVYNLYLPPPPPSSNPGINIILKFLWKNMMKAKFKKGGKDERKNQ